MVRIRKPLIYLGLLGMLMLPAEGLSTTDDALLTTISHLIKYLEDSNCVFIRNDKEYNSKEAAKHLKTKYGSFLHNVKTPEEFISLAASKSIVSGKPYWVRCDDDSPIPSADWLTEELANYRKTLPGDAHTK